MQTQYILLAILAWSLATSRAEAQLSTSANSFFISPGTTVTVSALSLTPTELTNLNSTEITHSDKAIPGKPKGSISRVYNFATPLNMKGKILITYLPEELNGNTEELLQLTTADQNKSYSIPSNKSTADPILKNVFESAHWTNISAITATETGSALPVTLIDFVAAWQEKNVILTWSTSFEGNSDYFEIQHSTNGKNWVALDEVKSNGNSNTDRTYSYIHEEPLAGENYYRMRMVDKDERFAFSRIRSVNIGNTLAFTFHPNPVVDWLTIQMPDQKAPDLIKILNRQGKVVYEAKNSAIKQSSTQSINLKHLSAGIYIVQVRGRDGRLHASKLIKN